MNFYDENKMKNLGIANKSPEVIETLDKGFILNCFYYLKMYEINH